MYFTNSGYQLETGNFKQLAQFKHSEIDIIFSDVTAREVLNHLTNFSEEARTKAISALRSCGKFWRTGKNKQNEVLAALFGNEESQKNAENQFNNFIERCGAETVSAGDLLNFNRLLDMYFTTTTPFEKSKEKKAEFPDAIALLTLEAWAEKNDTSILFITKDRGCQKFCEQSHRLHSISDLGDALTLVQGRKIHSLELCALIDEKIANDEIENFLYDIQTTVASDLWNIDWTIDADSAFYFDDELEDIELVELHLTGPQGDAELSPVDYSNGILVARTTVKATITATGNFSFSVRDGIDHDMVPMGGVTTTATNDIEIDILLSFESAAEGSPELVEIEVLPSRETIHFGSIAPDYSNEDYDED